MNGDIEELIKRFNKSNGNGNYSQRDLLKYLITRIDDIDAKVDSTNNKLDNHITTLSNRVTSIETSIDNFKWFFGGGIILAIIVGIVSIIIKI